MPKKAVDYRLRSFCDVIEASASGGQYFFNPSAAWKDDLFLFLLVMHFVAFINVRHA